MEQWDSNGGTVWWNSGTLVEQCGGTVTVEQSWWNSVVEKWNSHGGTVWWNRRTVILEQCGRKVEQCGGTVEQSWWNSVVEQWNSHGGTVWWNSGT